MSGAALGNLRELLSRNSSRSFLLFIGFLAAHFILQRTWLISGGMWAENATVFFATAVNGFQISDLFVLDAGYLPTFLHIVAAILALTGIPVSEMGFVYNWAGLVIASLPVIAFQMPTFRTLITRDSNRTLVIVLILAFQSYWSTTNFLNSGYSMIFLLFVSALHLSVSVRIKNSKSEDETPKLPNWLLLIAPFLMLTKPAGLAVVPVYLYLFFVLKGKQRLSAASVVLAGVLQVLVLAMSRFQNKVLEQGAEFDLVSQALNTIAYFLAFPFRVLVGPAWTDVLLGRWWSENTVGQWWSESNISLIFGALIIVSAATVATKASNKVVRAWIWVSLAMLFSASVLNNFTLWDVWNPSFYLFDAVPLHSRSLTMYIFTLGLFVGMSKALFVFLGELKSRQGTEKWFRFVAPKTVVLVWLLGSGWALYIPLFADEPKWPAIGSSNWASAPVNAADEFVEFCVAIEPWAWGVYGEGCKVVGRTEHSEFSRSPLTSGSIHLSPDLVTNPNELLALVGFAFYAEPLTPATYSLTITRNSVPDSLVMTGSLASNGEGTIMVSVSEIISLADVKSIVVSVENAVLYTNAENLSSNQVLSFVVARER